MKHLNLRQKAAWCRRAARSTTDLAFASALCELADDFERAAFDCVGSRTSVPARKSTPLADRSAVHDERKGASLSARSTIYLIDDSDLVRSSLRALLEAEGFQVIDFDNATDFLIRQREVGYGCIVTDIQMPRVNGLELIKQVRVFDPIVPIIAITAAPHAAIQEIVAAAGATLLAKPFHPGELIELVEAALRIA